MSIPTASVSGTDVNRDGIPDQLQQGGMGQQGMMNQQRPPVASVSGVDRNRDGIPDQLQQGGMMGQQGGMMGQQGMMNQQRAPVASVSGVDRNRDGIPDQLQQGGMIGQQLQGPAAMGQPMVGPITPLNQHPGAIPVQTGAVPYVSQPNTMTNPAYPTAVPLQTGAVPYTQSGAPTTIVTPTGATFATGDTAPPSALKGNITSIMGKMQHNPEKQHAGNAMVASSKEAKAAKFETKAIEWERKGNVTKAQKNRGKAAMLRQKAIAKLNQPTVTAYPPGMKNDKAARCELKALEYEKKGNLAKAQRNREKAYRIREKHGIAHPVGTARPMTTVPVTTTTY